MEPRVRFRNARGLEGGLGGLFGVEEQEGWQARPGLAGLASGHR